MLPFIIFSSGFIIMTFELVGARMLGPHYGTSVFVWSSIIGIILAAIALGYAIGGRFADRGATVERLSQILLTSALIISITMVFHESILETLASWTRDVRIGSILASIVLFAPASIFLGMISPYTVRLAITDVSSSGKKIGDLGALNTIGSIAGTFATGFFLLPLFGIRTLLMSLPIALLLLSLATTKRNALGSRLIVLGIIIGSIAILRFQENEAHSRNFDTLYSHIRIVDFTHPDTNEPMRMMRINVENHSTRSLVSDRLINRYTEFYHLAHHFVPNMKHALMLGGAGYSFPQSFLATYPDAHIDVVEIDPKVTELARTYFGLSDHPRLRIFHEDARVFLNHHTEKYDIILGDAFTSWYSVPYQLTTQEAIQKQYDLLSEDGVLILNVISSLEGKNSDFFRAEYHTLASVFPEVAVLPVTTLHDTQEIQNIILIAIKNPTHISWESDDPYISSMLSHKYMGEIQHDTPLLTDDYAPVERMVEKFLP